MFKVRNRLKLDRLRRSTMPNNRYTAKEIIKLPLLVEIETGKGKTTGQACKNLGFT